MPILTIQIPAGFSKQQKSSFLTAATQAVQESIQAPLSTIRANLVEIAPENTMVAGEMAQPMTLIYVALITGRDEAKKVALMAALTASVERTLGISTQHTRVLLGDFETTDLSVAGGISAKASGR